MDCRVFIDQTYHETKKARLLRAREEQDDFLETVLKIEHKVISSHKRKGGVMSQRLPTDNEIALEILADFKAWARAKGQEPDPKVQALITWALGLGPAPPGYRRLIAELENNKGSKNEGQT